MTHCIYVFVTQEVDYHYNSLDIIWLLLLFKKLRGFLGAAKSLLWLIAHFNTNVQTFLFLSSQLLAARLQIGIGDDNKKTSHILAACQKLERLRPPGKSHCLLKFTSISPLCLLLVD